MRDSFVVWGEVVEYSETIVRVESFDPLYCISLYKAIEPDNVDIPGGMSIETNIEKIDDRCIYEFRVVTPFNAKKFDSLRGTIDEILSIIEVIDETLIMLK